MPDRPANAFHTTRWTQVVAAHGKTPEAKQALRELCETYYAPVELFVRRSRAGMNSAQADDARDLTHEFFAKLLEGNSLENADRTRGRFRSYLLGAVKHFLSDQHDRDLTLKRGGGQTTQSLDQPRRDDEPLTIADPSGLPPDAYFDRQWALAVVEQAIATLRTEAETSGELARFEVLQRWLVTPSSHDTAIEAARSLKLSEGAFKVAVHRLRKRFRHIVVDRIASTVSDPVEAQDELNYLVSAMGR
ncbi:MAG: RNA polymerase sigma factor [Planctomycetaceae bacterium]